VTQATFGPSKCKEGWAGLVSTSFWGRLTDWKHKYPPNTVVIRDLTVHNPQKDVFLKPIKANTVIALKHL